MLASQPVNQETRRLQEVLALWLRTAQNWSGGIERITGLLDLALKKHPLAQEENNRWLPWVTGVLFSLHETFEALSMLSMEQVALVYRVFPRVVDVGHKEAHQLFVRFVHMQRRQEQQPAQMQQTLRAFKFANRRATRALCEGAWPQG